jgi:hypothetical protein
MEDTPQGFESPKVPDWQTAEFNRDLRNQFEVAPELAQRIATMLKLCQRGVDPSTAAMACALEANWDEDESLRAAAERAYAQHNARVQVNLGKHLATSSLPNATLMGLHLKAKGGYNEKAGEGWAQEIKILPTIVYSAEEAARLAAPRLEGDALTPNDIVLEDVDL